MSGALPLLLDKSWYVLCLINPLRTERNLFYLNTQILPRSKRSSLLFTVILGHVA